MTKRAAIIQELIELNSSLAQMQPDNSFMVPKGYFDGLAMRILSRIKALDAATAAGELACLSPVVSNLPKSNPYGIPGGYFESLPESLLHTAKSSSNESVQEETDSISSLLGNLKKQVNPSGPYTVPEHYFDKLAPAAVAMPPKAKLLSMMPRRWMRYAAAAIISGLLIAAGVFLLQPDSEKNSGDMVFIQLNKDLKKLSDAQKDVLLELVSTVPSEKDLAGSELKTSEIKQLLLDISEDELQDFSEQNEDLEDVLMIN